ncbi:hypothetical protein NIBR502774_18140 (plasmid) [Rhizobium sp. NIBRBAC000502774]|nr:hypothetical protein NIBR502774_18140 [Rhizobium sp. NIBRBAC000502774]
MKPPLKGIDVIDRRDGNSMGTTADNSRSVRTISGFYSDFLRELLNFESGLGVEQLDEFRQNYLNDEAVEYVVTHVREADGVRYPTLVGGAVQRRLMSYEAFFTVLGVNDIWIADEQNGGATSDTIRRMQFRSKNWLNFVGYQIGEAALFEAGYYLPATGLTQSGETAMKLYVWTDLSWADDQYEQEYTAAGTDTTVIVTRANTWLGTFTGKNGVWSFEDLLTVSAQNHAIRDIMWMNVDTIHRLIEASDQSLEEIFAKTFPWSGGGESGTVNVTMSGILASAHLTGAIGTSNLLLEGNISEDENGTSNTYYMYKFGGAETLMDTPAFDRTKGTEYPERLSCGMNGSDDLHTGGSGRNIIEIDCRPTATVGTVTIFDASLSAVSEDHDNISLVQIEDGATVVLSTSDTDDAAWLDVEVDGAIRRRIRLPNATASEVQTALADRLIVQERRWPLSWEGAHVVTIENFSSFGDRFYTQEGHQFTDLLVNKATVAVSGGIRLDVLDADDRAVFGYLLEGMDKNTLTERNFIDFIGSVTQMRSGYVLDRATTPLETVLTHFQLGMDKVYVSALAGHRSFSEATYAEAEGRTTFTFPSDGVSGKSIVFVGITWQDVVSAASITGMKGSLREVPHA